MNRLTRGLAAAALCAAVAAPPMTASAQPATLTDPGYGPYRVGMTLTQARRAVPGLTGERFDACMEATSPRYPGVFAMFENNRITRVSLSGNSRVRTAGGIRVGDTEAAVRARYGARLRQERHTYVQSPGKYLTVWTVGRQRGFRFEIDEHRIVRTIHAGGASIRYVEGCL